MSLAIVFGSGWTLRAFFHFIVLCAPTKMNGTYGHLCCCIDNGKWLGRGRFSSSFFERAAVPKLVDCEGRTHQMRALELAAHTARSLRYIYERVQYTGIVNKEFLAVLHIQNIANHNDTVTRWYWCPVSIFRAI